MAQSILGDRFGGVLHADGYAAYNAVNAADRQACLAHLIRKAKEIKQEILLRKPKFHDKAETLRKRLLDPNKEFDRLFTFLKYPEVQPTNNQAQQSLRNMVIMTHYSYLVTQCLASNIVPSYGLNCYARATRYGYQRARWRGLWRVQIQEYLTAAIQNIMILVKDFKEPDYFP